MGTPLRTLLVEDEKDDADLVLLELRRGGFDPDFIRVETASEMDLALGERPWDVVISDYSLPRFDALKALALLQLRGLDLPFIIVSGTIAEDTAVAAMKAGAHDYLEKGQLKRLPPAISRELREAAIRSEQREATAQLRQSESRLRSLIERLPGIVLVHREGRFVYVNPPSLDQLGYERAEEILGKPIDTIVHPDDRELVARSAAAAMRGETVPIREMTWLRKDGTVLTVEVSSQSVLFGGEAAVVSVARDVSEERKVQAQLLISDRMASIGTLAAGVAHEINNPLAAVLINLDYAIEELYGESCGDGNSAEVEEGLREARNSANRVKQIVRDLKIFSRSDDAERRGPVDVRRVLESTLRMAWNEIRHRARLVKDFGEVPHVLANDARLGQVFLNLIVNAAQAMPEGRAEKNEIRIVTAEEADGRVVIEVRDTGPGIPPVTLGKLFTPFFTTKPAGVGTGLGLSICQRLVSSFGGEITVSSEMGTGTTFRVLLPPAPSDEPEAVPVEPASAPPRAHRQGDILVVDDDPMIVKALSRTLGREHHLQSISSGAEALARIGAGERYDVILCDLMMPQMTGMDLYEELAVLVPEQAERMIFLTGGAFTPSARAFLDETKNLRVEKPFEALQLLGIVNDRIRALGRG